MLLPHHFNCLLRAVKVEFVILLSFLRMLFSVISLGTIRLSLGVHATVERLVVQASPVILRLAHILHSRQEKVVSHRRVEIRQ